MTDIPLEDQVECSLCHTVLDASKCQEHKLIDCINALQEQLDEKDDDAEVGRLVRGMLGASGIGVYLYTVESNPVVEIIGGGITVEGADLLDALRAAKERMEESDE